MERQLSHMEQREPLQVVRLPQRLICLEQWLAAWNNGRPFDMLPRCLLVAQVDSASAVHTVLYHNGPLMLKAQPIDGL
jgi:hypothetical protein